MEQEPWFLKINPNGRIPALTDASFADGQPIHLWESASIMQYLVERYDADHKLSYPRGSREAYEVNNWVYWQMGGLGPMQGQANHFFRESPPRFSEDAVSESKGGLGLMRKREPQATRPRRSSTASTGTRTRRGGCTASWRRRCRRPSPGSWSVTA